jgi:hypothetical protein
MKKASLRIFVLVLLAVLTTGAAWANDQIVSTVTYGSGPVPIIVNNGHPPGTIQLLYTVVATHYTCGQFATFNLAMVDQSGTGHGGVYPATLSLTDAGAGTGAQLSPAPASFSVSGVGWNDSSTVTVNIVDCSASDDGHVLIGNLQESVPGSAHIDTVSTVQVHIKLIVPSPACLKLYSFESDQDTFDLLTSVTVVAPHVFVKATNPGAVSVDGLVVNTCTTPETFDEYINLGQYWATNPGSNAGNSTFTYTLAGEVDPTTYSLATWGAGTQQGETVCINNFTLQPGDSFLTRVHSQIIGGTPVTSLPSSPPGFPFAAGLYVPNTSCAGSLLPASLVGPTTNPATSAMTWSLGH